MGAIIGVISTLVQWAGAIRGLWAFVVPFWGMIRGWVGRKQSGPVPAVRRAV
ncbi:hypothetical protein [Effusibacillus lacus]|uniref:hypothetical protein n=1 Tax=Effusibacillus lacus TaxID=1348429 RepID=UPI0014050F3F|nr:hypothetical protein [Effusibacillus lacus]